MPKAGLRLWPGQDPMGGGGNAQDWGGAIAPPCPMLATALYTGDISGGQKSQSGNQVAVNTDFNYLRTLDQRYL